MLLLVNTFLMTIVDNLKKLIEFKTLSGDKEALGRSHAWINKQLAGLPVYVKTITDEGFSSLIITTQKTKKPRILLAAHIDVVPGTSNVFKPVIKGKKLYGRGAYDMKFALACYLTLFRELGKDLSKHDIGILITPDEEIGGAHGTQAVLRKGYSADCCVLPDSGDENEIVVQAKGGLQFKVESVGKSAHASRPWEGINAIDNLTEYLSTLRDEFDVRFRDRRNIKECCSINVGTIKGGDKTNSIPGFAEATLDFRVFTEKEKDVVRQMVYKIAKKSKGLSVVEKLDVATFAADIRVKDVKVFMDIYKRTTKRSLRPSLAHGATDGRYLSQVGIPTILMRPVGGGHHSEAEWISISSLEEFYRVLKEFVTTNGAIS